MRLRSRRRRVRVRLTSDQFIVSGDGYDARVMAPFRFKTGVERKPASERQEETGFLRMVIDVHGKPLVLEEQLLPGSYPPPLDEIKGISSALGIAELTSDTPYPGTLWSLIERMEALAQISTPTSIKDEVASLLRIGHDQMNHRRFSEAIETFGSVIRLRPNSAQAYYSRGEARYFAREELDKAINDLTTALRLDPKQFKAYRMRGLVHAAKSDWAGMREDISLALQHNPGSAELHNLRGTACYRQGDYEAALANFERAIHLDAKRHESFYNRGLVKRQQGKLEQAMEDFQWALELNPAFADAERAIAALPGEMGAQDS